MTAVREVDERDVKLAELRAKRAELERAREEREAQYERDDEVEGEERAIRDEQALADAEQRIGRVGKIITTVETDLGLVILRRAHQASMKRFMDRAGEATTDDLLKLVIPCLVYPSKPEFEAMIDAQLLTLHRASRKLGELAGLRAKETVAK